MKFGNDLFIIVCIIVPLIWKKPYSQSKLNQYIIVRGSRECMSGVIIILCK